MQFDSPEVAGVCETPSVPLEDRTECINLREGEAGSQKGFHYLNAKKLMISWQR